MDKVGWAPTSKFLFLSVKTLAVTFEWGKD